MVACVYRCRDNQTFSELRPWMQCWRWAFPSSTFEDSPHFHHKCLLLWHVQASRAARCHDSPSGDSGIRLCLGETRTIFHFSQMHNSLKRRHISCFADHGSGVTVHVWARQGRLSEEPDFPRVPQERRVSHKVTWGQLDGHKKMCQCTILIACTET